MFVSNTQQVAPTRVAPILYESHMHTPLCNHARGEPEAYAAVAEERGLAGIIVTCHNPTENNGMTPHVRMRVDQFDDYVSMVERARRAWAGRVDVRLGMESDFLPGQESWLARLHDRAEFHHVLGSVHPQMQIYQDRYLNGDVRAFQRQYFTHLAEAAESGLFDTLSHPDIVKIVHPKKYAVAPLLDHIRGCLDRIAAAGTAMELNTSGLNKSYPEMNPSPTILAEMRARGIPVVLGGDAHDAYRVGANYLDALDLLEAAGYTQISMFLERKRRDLDISVVRESLRVMA